MRAILETIVEHFLSIFDRNLVLAANAIHESNCDKTRMFNITGPQRLTASDRAGTLRPRSNGQGLKMRTLTLPTFDKKRQLL